MQMELTNQLWMVTFHFSRDLRSSIHREVRGRRLSMPSTETLGQRARDREGLGQGWGVQGIASVARLRC